MHKHKEARDTKREEVNEGTFRNTEQREMTAQGGKNLSENKITIKHFNFQRQHFSKSGAGAGDGTTAGNCLSMQ